MVTLVFAATLRVFGSAGAESLLTPSRQMNVADVSAFADASTERWKLHVKLRADASDRNADRVRAGEAWVSYHPTKWLDLTAGRVIEKWGTGYAWNPTAFVGPAKDPTDPSDRRSAYRGVDMVRADAFVRGTNISLYALERGEYAARVYRLIHGTDVSLVWKSGAAGFQPAVGISVARVFGNALELHAEATQDRALAGGQYTFANDVNVVFELYRHGSTYTFARVQWHDVELIAIADLHNNSTIVRASLTRRLRPNVSAYVIQTEFLGRNKPVARATTAGIRYWF